MRVGFIGPMHSGKTTAARLFQDYVEKDEGFRPDRVSFAKELKRLTMEFVNGTLGINISEEEFKSLDQGRKTLQAIGWIGRWSDEDYWVDRVDVSPQFGVVDDCRFQNEARFLKSNGYTLVRVWRPYEERKRSVIDTIIKANKCSLKEAEDLFLQQQNDPSEQEQEGIITDTTIQSASTTTFGEYPRLADAVRNLYESLKEGK